MKILLLGVLLLFQLASSAQKQANVWYFGIYAGMDFSGGSPVALTNSAMDAFEGCSSVSDANGKLLFYTRGDSVWNRNHKCMSNGAKLAGCPSSTQSSIIIPFPSAAGRYYIFTTDCEENSGAAGLQYSVVDMAGAGGLGAVMLKNINLYKRVTEKVAAVRHSNGQDIWVVSHSRNSDSFLVYLVTKTGVSNLPIVSRIGSSYGTAGQLKISPDATTIAAAITFHSPTVELFHFNNTTGKLSDKIAISLPDTTCYGVEFSPDSKKLYCTTTAFSWGDSNQLHQLDLAGTWNASAINSSRTVIYTAYDDQLAQLQLGPDKRIYVAHRDWPSSTFLGVINSPNSKNCNYNDTGMYLGGKLCDFGLPNFFQDFIIPYKTSVDEVATSFTVQIFPNPISAKGTIKISENMQGVRTLSVYNSIGKIVLEKKCTTASIEFTRAGLPAGIYFLRVRGGNGEIAKANFLIAD